MKLCTVEGCNRERAARGWCHTHYLRWWRHGDINAARPKGTTCTIDGCEKPHAAHGFCQMHYARRKHHGDPHIVIRRAPRFCSVVGCERQHVARGYCHLHYDHWRRYGDPCVGRRIMHYPPTQFDCKFCQRCHVYKAVSYFSPLKHAKDKLNGWCKNCHVESQRERKKRDPAYATQCRASSLKSARRYRIKKKQRSFKDYLRIVQSERGSAPLP